KALEEAIRWIGKRGRCEAKPAAAALHWRGLPAKEAQALREHAMKRWPDLAKGAGLEITEFDGGIEIRVAGKDKGFAVKTLLSELGEGAVAAYLGDDQTDEDAFRAIRGSGLGVLVRESARSTAAAVLVRPPEELLDFLTEWRKIEVPR
ncbi:MAG: trehalose-phosphatase, partial [Planctomycetota bacterium]